MDAPVSQGFFAALSEVSARLADLKEGCLGVGVVSLYARPDAALYRLPLEHIRRLEREMERQLRARLRPQDGLFALDGKEWLIVLPNLSSPAVLTLAMLKFEQAFNEAPIEIEGVTLALRVVCGAAMSPDHGQDAFHLLQSARIAGLMAGRAELGSQIYEPSMEQHSPSFASLERDLREAFSGGRELELHLQPKVHLASAECRSAEALLRWRRRDGQWVPPRWSSASSTVWGFATDSTAGCSSVQPRSSTRSASRGSTWMCRSTCRQPISTMPRSPT